MALTAKWSACSGALCRALCCASTWQRRKGSPPIEFNTVACYWMGGWSGLSFHGDTAEIWETKEPSNSKAPLVITGARITWHGSLSFNPYVMPIYMRDIYFSPMASSSLRVSEGKSHMLPSSQTTHYKRLAGRGETNVSVTWCFSPRVIRPIGP